jgi:hypothetical protein
MKMMILAPRRDGISHEAFRRYVTEVHGPLVKSVPEVARAIRRYHYNFPVFGAADLAFNHPIATHLDIVTQGWFDSREAQLQNMAEPRYLAEIRPDEHRFANGAAAVMHYTREVSVLEGAATAMKVFYFRRRRSQYSREHFQEAWQIRFADALKCNPYLHGVVSRYVQNHTLPEAEHPEGYAPKYFDVIDELNISDAASLGALRADGPCMTDVAALESELLEPGYVRALVSETVINIA